MFFIKNNYVFSIWKILELQNVFKFGLLITDTRRKR